MHFLQTTFQLVEIGKLRYFLYQKCTAAFQSIQFKRYITIASFL